MPIDTPLWKLRRLAPRSERVLQRRAGEDPAIAAYQDTLGPHAASLRKGYDVSARYRAEWRREMIEGRSAMGLLLEGLRSWLPLFQRDVEGFDASAFGDSPSVPDDVLEDAGQLLDVALDYATINGTALLYHEAFISSFEPLVKEATREWAEAEAADRKYQSLMSDVRDAAELFQRDLVAFRRTLAAVVGRSDKDYQKLRATRAHLKDEDDDEDAPSAPKKVKPAEPGQDAPVEG